MFFPFFLNVYHFWVIFISFPNASSSSLFPLLTYFLRKFLNSIYFYLLFSITVYHCGHVFFICAHYNCILMEREFLMLNQESFLRLNPLTYVDARFFCIYVFRIVLFVKHSIFVILTEDVHSNVLETYSGIIIFFDI